MHALLEVHKRAAADGGELWLIIPPTTILRVFALTGMDQIIPTFTSLDRALAQASADGPDGHR
jgi:anti-anti-sigma regulatory factor